MIYFLNGAAVLKKNGFAVIEVSGVGYKVFFTRKELKSVIVGKKLRIFCHFSVKQDGFDLYGFLSETELDFFELLIGVSGVGPKSALNIMGDLSAEQFVAAIRNNRSDVLSEGAGIGRKKADRIIVELKDTVKNFSGGDLKGFSDEERDIEEALISLGYKKKDVRVVIDKIPESIKGTSQKIKEALKILGKK